MWRGLSETGRTSSPPQLQSMPTPHAGHCKIIKSAAGEGGGMNDLENDDWSFVSQRSPKDHTHPTLSCPPCPVMHIETIQLFVSTERLSLVQNVSWASDLNRETDRQWHHKTCFILESQQQCALNLHHFYRKRSSNLSTNELHREMLRNVCRQITQMTSRQHSMGSSIQSHVPPPK